MTEHPRPPVPTEERHLPEVDAGRLWAGGLATALVAALIVIVAAFVIQAFVTIPVVPPLGATHLGDMVTLAYALLAALAAIAATGLLHVLLVATPRPLLFFSWIVALTTVVAVVTPFLAAATRDSQLVTAAINLVVGIAILSLLNGVGLSAARRP